MKNNSDITNNVLIPLHATCYQRYKSSIHQKKAKNCLRNGKKNKQTPNKNNNRVSYEQTLLIKVKNKPETFAC